MINNIFIILIYFLLSVFKTYAYYGQVPIVFENDGENTVQKSTTEFIAQFGYPYETHQVVTEDGYILEIHHIPSTRSLKYKHSRRRPNSIVTRQRQKTRNLKSKNNRVKKNLVENELPEKEFCDNLSFEVLENSPTKKETSKNLQCNKYKNKFSDLLEENNNIRSYENTSLTGDVNQHFMDYSEKDIVYGKDESKHVNFLSRLKRNSYYRDSKGSVLLMHGLMSSSADWVVTGPEKGLAFLLADSGYDIWLGNARGNKYSRHHISLDPDNDYDFWKFSWHEIGTQDLPAIIDYILDKTGVEQISYVGHSQGTTAFFVMTSEKPEYNEKVKSMHALAPVAYIRHCTNPYAMAGMPLVAALENLDQKYGPREMFPPNDEITKLSNFLCSDENAIRGVCVKLYLAAFGFDPWNVNRTLIPDIMNNIPAGVSSRQFVHYGQLIRTGRFAKYDFGIRQNKENYNSLIPPSYNFSNMTCSIALYYGDMDNLATPPDVRHLSGVLPNVIEVYRVNHSRWNHVDFLWAVNVKELLYDRVMENIEKFND